MHSEPLDQWLVPPRGADALIRDADGNPWWISAAWAEDGAPRVGQETGAEAAARLLEEIAAAPTTPHRQLNDTESDEDFTGYLYAGFPDDITVIGMGTSGWHVGYADADGAAVLRRTVTDGVFRHDVVHYGTQNALDTLRSWVESWRAAGRPGYGDLQPVLRGHVTAGRRAPYFVKTSADGSIASRAHQCPVATAHSKPACAGSSRRH